MGANLGQKSTVLDGLALCLDTANPSSASAINNLTGEGFTSSSSPEDGSGWQRVAAGESNFVSMNSNGTNQIAYSTDGITWTSASATQDNWWFGLAYGNGKFVMVARGGVGGNAGNVIINYASESNLSSWTGVTPSQDNNWNAVTYGNGKFVAVSGDGTNQVMYASDSSLGSWTMASEAESNDWRGIAYGNGKFVAVAQDGTNRVMYASDSDVTSWTSASAAEANEWKDVAFGDGYFVAVSYTGTNRVMYSTDGINWTAAAAAAAVKWNQVVYGDGYFVAVSYTDAAGGATTANSVMWAKSSDPSTWTLTTIEEQGEWTGIGFKQGRFVICSYGESTNRFAYSDISNPNNWIDISLSKVYSVIPRSPTFNLGSLGSYIELNTGSTTTQWYYMRPEYYSKITWGANPYAIELWVNRYDGYYVMDMRVASDGDGSYLTFASASSNRLVWRAYGGSTLFGSDADNPTATDETWTGWRHYVISREGTDSNECKLYYNGSLISTGTDGGTHATPPKFILGIRGYDNTTPFKGRIGLFKVYKGKALSATEVLQNYNATKERYK